MTPGDFMTLLANRIRAAARAEDCDDLCAEFHCEPTDLTMTLGPLTGYDPAYGEVTFSWHVTYQRDGAFVLRQILPEDHPLAGKGAIIVDPDHSNAGCRALAAMFAVLMGTTQAVGAAAATQENSGDALPSGSN